MRLAILVSVIPLSALFSQEQVGAAEETISALLTRAYSALQTNAAGALPLFEQVVARDSTNLPARRQLGILYTTLGRYENALIQFDIAQRLSPSDTVGLQIAYLLNTLGRNQEAYRVFSGLQSSNDATIREKARIASGVLSSQLCSESFPWWGRSYAVSYYESRFEDFIFSGNLYIGRYLEPSSTLSTYGILSLTRDTRSAGGTLPVIFSDNFVLLGVGLRLQPADGLLADLQAGIANDLIETNSQSRSRGDVRCIITYGNGFFPEPAIPEHVLLPFKLFADVYSSFGYYSRYQNAIGYHQARAGVRALEWMYSSVDVYLRGDFVIDTQREFFNNVIEGSVGLRLIAYQPWGIAMLAEFHQGSYWGDQAPVEHSYHTFRFFLIVDRTLCF